MPVKIICLEEHIADKELGEAAVPALLARAPYFADQNSEYVDDPDAPGTLPALVSTKTAAQLSSQPIEARVAAMDAAGIDVQVLSHSATTQFVAADKAAALASGANVRIAAIAALHPDRFAAFATLPWQAPDAAAREVERVAGLPGVVGAMLVGRAGEDVMADDPRFEPVLAALAAAGLPLYVHPGPPMPAVREPYYARLGREVSARASLFGWGWHNEAGVQVVRLILSGALDRHPGLKIISGHWGEMVPFFLQRMDDTMPRGATKLSRTISQTYRDQVWITPSGMLNLPHFRFCREVLGPDRILFAVDYPYLTLRGARAWVEALPGGDDERAAIAHGNAERLLGLG